MHAVVAQKVLDVLASLVLAKEARRPPTACDEYGHAVDLGSETAVAESCEQESSIDSRTRGEKLGQRKKNAAEALLMRSAPRALIGSCGRLDVQIIMI